MKRIFQLAAFLILLYPLNNALLGQEAIDSLESALLIAEDDQEKLEIYEGLIRGLAQQNPVKAVQYAEDALELVQEFPDSVLLPDLHNAVGIAHYYKGNLLISIEYFLKARVGYELLGRDDKAANTLNNIGVTYEEIENYEKSKEFYFESLKVHKRLNNLEIQTAVYNNIGSTFEALDQLDSAEYYYNKSLELARDNNPDENMANALGNLGNVYYKREEYTKALDYQRRALSYDLKNNNIIGLVETYSSMGLIYLGLNNYNRAYESFNKALSICKEHDLKSREAELYENFSDYYEKLGDFQNAYIFYLKHTQLKDSIFTLEMRKQIEDLQLSYQANRREQEIALLNERNNLKDTQLQLQTTKTRLLLVFTIFTVFVLGLLILNVRVKGKANALLQKQNEKIQQQNQELEDRSIKLEELSHEKDNFINVVAHDLKSPLNNITGLANLIRINGKLSEEQLHYLNLLDQVSIESKNLVSNLLDLNKLELGLFEQQIEDFEVKDTIDKIIHNYEKAASEKNIVLKKSCPGNISIRNNREFIERILDNLVSNAIKFSPNNKEVFISCDYNYQFLVLSVKDEGPGISKKEQQDLFKKFIKLSPRPTGGESSTGLGLAIVKLLVDKLEGEIEVLSKEKKGTEIRIKFPASFSSDL
ncbi:MAG: tetratricopeptide repeat-containing sensor histidine kinase [Cyclobacteriaceae bacterium]|jgi:signal transduction histidine kinase